jgi:hypothetical protein
MPLPPHPVCIEYSSATGVVLVPGLEPVLLPSWFPIDPDHCLALLQTLLRSHYAWNAADELVPMRKYSLLVEFVRVVGADGQEICRWSVENERYARPPDQKGTRPTALIGKTAILKLAKALAEQDGYAWELDLATPFLDSYAPIRVQAFLLSEERRQQYLSRATADVQEARLNVLRSASRRRVAGQSPRGYPALGREAATPSGDGFFRFSVPQRRFATLP